MVVQDKPVFDNLPLPTSQVPFLVLLTTRGKIRKYEMTDSIIKIF